MNPYLENRMCDVTSAVGKPPGVLGMGSGSSTGRYDPVKLTSLERTDYRRRSGEHVDYLVYGGFINHGHTGVNVRRC